ncbi:DUF935 family protein [Riemerella anatipestifer]|nr:DUF935 family protein [Riemerella anatipestifer]
MNLNDIKNSIQNAFRSKPEREHEEAVLKMVNAIKNQRSLYKKEIREWKMARAVALNPNHPRRGMLIDLYDDILGDAFIYGRSDARKLRVSNKSVALVNNAGEIDDDKTKLFQKKWVNDFIKLTIDSIYYGYTLIYPDVLDENGWIKEITNVYRDHIVPETKEILQNRSDMEGVRFDEEPLKNWVIWVNHKQFLGLLDKAAPLWIFKKHSWQNWDEFEELFGIPIRTAKVASTDPRVKREVDRWLKDLGSANWARFPEGVDIDIKESQSRDSFNVFNEKRKACNEELATLFDGHSETAKDTGSRAKSSEIIKATQDLITQDDETFVLSVMNDQLLPLMRFLGYPIAEDDELIWNENTKSDPKERLEIFKGVKELGYKVKKEQIETELDVEIEGEYTPPLKPTPTPNNRSVNFKTPHNGSGCCEAHQDYRNVDLSILQNARDLTPDEVDFLKQLYNNPNSINWSYKEFKATHYALLDALKRGAPVLNYDFKANDHRRMRIWMDNVFRFGCDKTTAEVHELNELRKSCKSFHEFRTKAKGVFPKYKEYHLQAEWEHANAVSAMGAKQQEMMEDIEDAPFWRFSAILDDGTTDTCKHLDGKVFRKDDKKAWKFLPPLHWRCRSDAEDVLEGYDGEVISFEDAVGLDPEAWERMQKQGFDVNWGDANELFQSTDNYLKGLEPLEVDTLNFETYGLSAFTDIKKAKAPKRISKIQRFIDKTGKARVIDVHNLPAWIDTEQLALDDTAFTRVKETLQMPDEIYWSDANGLKTQRYFRFYEDGAMVVETQSVKVTKVELTTTPDANRRGLLVYTPKDYLNYYEKVYKSYDDTWSKEYFSGQNGGYLVIDKQRIENSNISKRETLKFKKEKEMARVYAQNGYQMELWKEISGISSPDGSANSIAVDLKSVSSHNNIVKYAKKAVREQGAEMVLFEFTKETDEIHWELLALKKIGIKAMYYFKDQKEVYKNF